MITKKLRIAVLLFAFLLVSCGSEEGSEFLGKWQSQKFPSGNSVILEIEEDGELYKVKKYTVDDKGEMTGDKYDNTYVVPLENGVLHITPLDKASYSENDGKIYYNKGVFTKIE